MPLTITIEDSGWSELPKRLKKLGKVQVEGGLFTPAQAQKGHWLEFGFEHAAAGPIEARPWASAAGDANAQAYGTAMGVAIGEVADGKDIKAALAPVGEMVADSMAAVIGNREVGGPELADSTVDAKGHGIKGLDSGKMLKSIKSRVTRAKGVTP